MRKERTAGQISSSAIHLPAATRQGTTATRAQHIPFSTSPCYAVRDLSCCPPRHLTFLGSSCGLVGRLVASGLLGLCKTSIPCGISMSA
jgi:hypothetical protein